MTNFLPLNWTGLEPPDFDNSRIPQHVAVVMDGNGRWANAQGLPRIEGHKAGETALLDVVAGALQAGVSHLSVYAFSTENWNRSPEEVKFLMGFNRDVLRRRRDQLNEWGVRIRLRALLHQDRSRPGGLAKKRLPKIFTCPLNPMWTCLSEPRVSGGPATFCCGRARMRKWSSCPHCGRI